MNSLIRVSWQEFSKDIEKYPYTLQQTADKMGISPKQLKEAFCAGKVYETQFGNLVIL